MFVKVGGASDISSNIYDHQLMNNGISYSCGSVILGEESYGVQVSDTTKARISKVAGKKCSA